MTPPEELLSEWVIVFYINVLIISFNTKQCSRIFWYNCFNQRFTHDWHFFCLGAEDIKTHMDEFQDAMTLGQRLTDQDILELQILIEQAVHEIKHLKPQV